MEGNNDDVDIDDIGESAMSTMKWKGGGCYLN